MCINFGRHRSIPSVNTFFDVDIIMARKSGIYDDLFKTVCGYPKVVGSIGKFFSSVQFIKKLISGDTGIAMVE